MKFSRCLLAVSLLAWGACNDLPGAPDPVLPEAASTPEPVEVAPAVVAPQPTADPRWFQTSKWWKYGFRATYTRGRTLEGNACVCSVPGGKQWLVASVPFTITKGTHDINFGGAWEQIVQGKTCQLQVDLTRGSCDCPAPPGGILAYKHYAGVSCPECVEGRTTTTRVEEGKWGECSRIVQASNEENGYDCERSREITTITTHTPKCEGEPEIIRETKTEKESCLCPTPPPCVDTPGGDVSVNASGNPLLAAAAFSDSGEWRLRILAASSKSECENDDPDFVKRNVRKTLECDEQGTLATSYSWHGHGSDWWWATLKRNGSLVDRTECIRNPTD